MYKSQFRFDIRNYGGKKPINDFFMTQHHCIKSILETSALHVTKPYDSYGMTHINNGEHFSSNMKPNPIKCSKLISYQQTQFEQGLLLFVTNKAEFDENKAQVQVSTL